MTTATISEYLPHRHVMRGFTGDGIPNENQVFEINFPNYTVDAGTWTVVATLFSNSGAILHTFNVVAEDTSDDPVLETTELRLTLAPLAGSESTTLGVGVHRGDIVVTPLGGQPITVVLLELEVKRR